MLSSYLKALYGCFFEPELFRNVVYRWKNASGIGFATLIVAVFSIISAAQFVVKVPPVADAVVNHAALSAPHHYTFKDGELTIDKELPYTMTFRNIVPQDIQEEMNKDTSDEGGASSDTDKEEWDRPLVVFRDSVSMDDLKDYPNGVVLVGKRKIITSKENGEVRIHTFDKVKDGSFNLNNYLPFHLETVLGAYRYIAAIFFWFFFFAGMWVGFVIKAFFIALLSYVVSAFIRERSLIFNDRFRIAIFSLAPVFIIMQGLELVDITIGFWASVLAALLYFGAYVIVARSTKSLMAEE